MPFQCYICEKESNSLYEGPCFCSLYYCDECYDKLIECHDCGTKVIIKNKKKVDSINDRNKLISKLQNKIYEQNQELELLKNHKDDIEKYTNSIKKFNCKINNAKDDSPESYYNLMFNKEVTDGVLALFQDYKSIWKRIFCFHWDRHHQDKATLIILGIQNGLNLKQLLLDMIIKCMSDDNVNKDGSFMQRLLFSYGHIKDI